MNSSMLRKLPKVDEILKESDIISMLEEYPRIVVIKSIRIAIDEIRNDILKKKIEKMVSINEIIEMVKKLILKDMEYSLKSVINGTGIIIHTNLGRSLLNKSVMEHVSKVSSEYSNLEYDIEKSERGLRYTHIERLIMDLTGAEGALIVNNNAAAVMLSLSTVAYGKEIIVSRGELVEIGGSFRIPEVMKISGATLVEVGTTNKTHLKDFVGSINESTGAILKVHTSNYKIVGFTKEVDIEDLVALGKKENIPVIFDLGSGTLVDFTKYGLSQEPTVIQQVQKGIDIITFSGDKLLGGPQAGVIIGKKKYINMIKNNQLTRALRVDKMTIAALEATLLTYYDMDKAIKEIPTFRMITESYDDVKIRGEKLMKSIEDKNLIKLIDGESQVGGGTYPLDRIKSVLIEITSENISVNQFSNKLRMLKTPIISRIMNDKIILDIRTLLDDDFDYIANSINTIMGR